MKKIMSFLLCAISLLTVVGCKAKTNINLSEYHQKSETWNYSIKNSEYYDENSDEEINYFFCYVSSGENYAHLTITRNNVLLKGGEPFDKIYIYCNKIGTYDYITIDGEKPKEEYYFRLGFFVGIYCVGNNNKADFLVYRTSEKFNGYIKAVPYNNITSSGYQHFIRIDMY